MEAAANTRKQLDPRAVAFGRRLQGILDKKGLSRRAFAKLVSPTHPENVRRAVHRHLEGVHMPARLTRRHYEVVLGLKDGSLEADDDEEADPALREAFALFVDLMDRLEERRQGNGSNSSRSHDGEAGAVPAGC